MGVDARIEFETSERLSKAELNDLRYRINDAHNCIWIHRAKGAKNGPIEQPAIESVDGVRWYRVNLMPRYYGEKYERGPWPELAGVIEWLKRQPQVTRVFYGGDCDTKLEEATPDVLDSLWWHFAENGHLPYLGVSKEQLCPDCGGWLWNSGISHGRDMYSCPGCGWSDWNDKETEITTSGD